MILAFVCNYWQFVAKEGETVEPGTKVAVISRSGEGIAHVAPSEKIAEKAVPKNASAPQEKKEEKPKPTMEKYKTTAPPPPKPSATEPQLPPKERERRVSTMVCYYKYIMFIKEVFIYFKQVPVCKQH